MALGNTLRHTEFRWIDEGDQAAEGETVQGEVDDSRLELEVLRELHWIQLQLRKT